MSGRVGDSFLNNFDTSTDQSCRGVKTHVTRCKCFVFKVVDSSAWRSIHVLQRSGAAVARLCKLEKNADNETRVKSRTDANLTNLRTGTDQTGVATSTHWIGIAPFLTTAQCEGCESVR